MLITGKLQDNYGIVQSFESLDQWLVELGENAFEPSKLGKLDPV